mmetsp:Transcript_10451/g.29383  ORF Transcript_10451/g.29383 Transcript_10451/m.29383 type:complete len:101 (-) Transcript_10451:34-336(-)
MDWMMRWVVGAEADQALRRILCLVCYAPHSARLAFEDFDLTVHTFVRQTTLTDKRAGPQSNSEKWLSMRALRFVGTGRSLKGLWVLAVADGLAGTPTTLS